jgi:hypothetical protein
VKWCIPNFKNNVNRDYYFQKSYFSKLMNK